MVKNFDENKFWQDYAKLDSLKKRNKLMSIAKSVRQYCDAISLVKIERRKNELIVNFLMGYFDDIINSMEETKYGRGEKERTDRAGKGVDKAKLGKGKAKA